MKIKKMLYASLFAAITAIVSQIAFPLPASPVPVNLALLSVILSGALLGPNIGVLSTILYLMLGIIGLPVFAQFQGGLAYLTSYTGGFLIGYIPVSFTVGFLYKKKNINFFISALLGILICYFLGMIWFSYVSGCNFQVAFISTVLPYMPADIFKILTAYFLIKNKNINSIFNK